MRSVSALRAEEAHTRAERKDRRAEERGLQREDAEGGQGQVDMLQGMSLPREPKKKGWWGNDEEEEDGDEDKDEDEEEGEEGQGEGSKWSMIWMEGRSVGVLADPQVDGGREQVRAFWSDVRAMLQEDGVLALVSTVLRCWTVL